MTIRRVTPHEAPRARADEAAVANRAEHAPIRRGAQGPAVESLQRELKAAGCYAANVDGDFGPITQAGVKAFQKARGLAETGAVNAETAAALSKNDLFVHDHFAEAAHRGQSGKDVLGIEKKLHALGYDTGKVDGVFGGATVKAVRAFRKDDKQLPDDKSVVDTQFEARLDKAIARDPLAGFDKTAPSNNYKKVSYSGVTINERTKEMIQRADKIMQEKFGHKGFHFDLTQGSYTNDVGASAGTHAGGGAMDVHDAGFSRKTVDDMVKALRTAGFAAWSRGRGHDSFPPHIHAIALGDRQMSSAARQQVSEYASGGDGLSGSALDSDRTLGRPVPTWAKRFV